MIRNNKFSIVVSLLILYLSLADVEVFENAGFFDIPYLDKMAHTGLYFLFMSVILYEHRNYFENTRKIILIALIPFIFGSIIEFLQSGVTATRKGDILDIMFNSTGIAGAVFIWLFVKPYYQRKL